MTKLTDEQRVARGQRAVQELRLTDEAFTALEQDIMRRLVETPADHPERILHFHRTLQNLDSVKHALKLVVADGNAASAIIETGLSRQ